MTSAAASDSSGDEANDRWGKWNVALHWISAALIVGLITAGFVMADQAPDSDLRLLLSRLHTGSGLTLMVLTVIRLVTRLRSRPPEPLALAPLHRRGVAFVHGALYVVLFGLGASGAVTGATSAWPDYLRGSLERVPELEQLASRQVHEALVFTLGTLIVLHIGGVMVHELRVGGALRRMLPWLRA